MHNWLCPCARIHNILLGSPGDVGLSGEGRFLTMFTLK